MGRPLVAGGMDVALRALLEALAEKGTLVAPEAADRLAEVPVDTARHVLIDAQPELPLILTEAELERLLADAPAAPAPEPAEPASNGNGNGNGHAAPTDAPAPAASPEPAPSEPARAPAEPATASAEAAASAGAASASASAAMAPAAPAPAPPAPAPAPAVAPAEELVEEVGEGFVARRAAEVKGMPLPPRPRVVAEPYAHTLDVLADITGNSTCEGAISDFTRYFNDRLGKLKKILRQRRELVGHVPIKNIREGVAEVKLIGVVTTVRSTKNGHRLIELEDETGQATILAPANNDHLISEAESVIEDEVLGVVCKPPRKDSNLLLLERLIRPEIPVAGERHRSPHGSAVALISDIHFGANTFLYEDWERFIRWINGEYGNKRMQQLARKVKYLVVNGDIVDGIGIFPGQEDELDIPDAAAQYEYAGHEFARIRDDVQIIMLPGNHDMVRPAEPQPALPEKYRQYFDPSVKQVGNPAKLSIEGVEFLSYHGFSMVDWNTRIAGLSFEEPTNTMREMLQRRHVCPMYGLRTPIAPEHKDYLVIDTVPDVFITGHIHAFGMEKYRGVTMVNASTWQSQTAYQKMHGFVPDPSKAAVIELDNGRAHALDFHRGAAGVDAVGRSKFGKTDPNVHPEF